MLEVDAALGFQVGSTDHMPARDFLEVNFFRGESLGLYFDIQFCAMEAEERLIPVDEAAVVHDAAKVTAAKDTAESSHEVDDNNDIEPSDNDEDDPHNQNEDGSAPTNGLKRKRTPPPEGMTISAFKRLKRQQRWEAGKADRKAKKKEAERNKKAARKAAIASGEVAPPPPKAAREKATPVPVTIVIDCGFDDLMTEQEIKSLASQITRCYSDNNRARYRVQICVSGFDKRLKERFETVLQGQYKGWKGITFHAADFVSVSESAVQNMKEGNAKVEGALAASEEAAGEIVYLSSESENNISALSPHSTYIIGGIVDRNRHKGLCYKRACERGIKTAKLPIGEFMQMNSRQVLATNHVNEIMLHWLEVGDWGEAFMKVIPKRKGGVLKGAEGEGAEENGGVDGQEADELDGGDDQARDDGVEKADEAEGTPNEVLEDSKQLVGCDEVT